MRAGAFWGTALALILSAPHFTWAQEAFPINEALKQAINTHPGVGEAAANRRATETELRQQQSTLLPQIRLETRIGPERFSQPDITPPPLGNNQTLNGRLYSVFARQLIFDGFTSINEIWRQSARVCVYRAGGAPAALEAIWLIGQIPAKEKYDEEPSGRYGRRAGHRRGGASGLCH